MINSSKYYTSSGKYTFSSIILSSFFGVIGTIIGSVSYTYLIYWIPFVYVNFIVTIGFGLFIGFCVSYGLSMGKSRSLKISALLGLIFGLFAYYLSWCFYSYVNLGFLLIFPSSIIKLMKVGVEQGFWSLGRLSSASGTSENNVRGFILEFFWFIEAMIILGGSIFLPVGTTLSKVFCEKCNKWVEGNDFLTGFEPIEDINEFTQELENADYSFLKRLEEVTLNSSNIELSYCNECNDLHIMSVKNKKIYQDEKGNLRESSNIIISNLLLSKEQFQIIKAL